MDDRLSNERARLKLATACFLPLNGQIAIKHNDQYENYEVKTFYQTYFNHLTTRTSIKLGKRGCFRRMDG